uniref:Secreted protein n=1 Tax=Rhizophora mucronata TaxID=61149 RepID=A0A2P2P7N6_RHIMU
MLQLMDWSVWFLKLIFFPYFASHLKPVNLSTLQHMHYLSNNVKKPCSLIWYTKTRKNAGGPSSFLTEVRCGLDQMFLFSI